MIPCLDLFGFEGFIKCPLYFLAGIFSLVILDNLALQDF
jgi:hypothetical protein